MRILTMLAVFCACGWGQDRQPERVVVDPRAICHVEAGAESAARRKITVGARFYAAAVRSEGQAMWFLFGTDPACWVDGRFTRISLGDAAANWTGILEYMSARRDAALGEYIAVDDELGRARVESARVEFRRLQMIQAALGSFDVMKEKSYPKSEVAWLDTHGTYFGAGGDYRMPASEFWKLYDANKDLPWAEEIAWAAVSIAPGVDDCAAECEIQVIVSKDLPYWTRLPSGPHVKAVLGDAVATARSAAQWVCSELGDRPARANTLDRVRSSLDDVASPLKSDLLRYLDQAGGRCNAVR